MNACCRATGLTTCKLQHIFVAESEGKFRLLGKKNLGVRDRPHFTFLTSDSRPMYSMGHLQVSVQENLQVTCWKSRFFYCRSQRHEPQRDTVWNRGKTVQHRPRRHSITRENFSLELSFFIGKIVYCERATSLVHIWTWKCFSSFSSVMRSVARPAGCCRANLLRELVTFRFAYTVNTCIYTYSYSYMAWLNFIFQKTITSSSRYNVLVWLSHPQDQTTAKSSYSLDIIK